MIVGYVKKINNKTYDYICVKYLIGFVDLIIYLGNYNNEMKKILEIVKESEEIA
jgi:hypothetical protein